MTDLERLQDILYQQFLKEFEDRVKTNNSCIILRQVYYCLIPRLDAEGFKKYLNVNEETVISL